MSDLTKTAGVLTWACTRRGLALVEGPVKGVFSYEPDRATAARIAKALRLLALVEANALVQDRLGSTCGALLETIAALTESEGT